MCHAELADPRLLLLHLLHHCTHPLLSHLRSSTHVGVGVGYFYVGMGYFYVRVGYVYVREGYFYVRVGLDRTSCVPSIFWFVNW